RSLPQSTGQGVGRVHHIWPDEASGRLVRSLLQARLPQRIPWPLHARHGHRGWPLMRRAFAILAILLLPGALVLAGLVAAFRYVFRREEILTAETMRRINEDAERSARLRDMDDELVRGKRPVVADEPRQQ